jgi:hypothetical protein
MWGGQPSSPCRCGMTLLPPERPCLHWGCQQFPAGGPGGGGREAGQ